ncbi:MAG: hypothetical protein LQ350_008324 [Teloschistes chrysophthalmus]|nr:MAG: hypothetical protein LQ350_008324 [Niorma chrysophthalma]
MVDHGLTRPRSYKDAIERLNSLQTGFEILEENRRTGNRPKRGVEEIQFWLKRIGRSVSDLDGLSTIHVAGTKGKGGTCSFIDAIFKEYRIQTSKPAKVGLYTSPHIKQVRERIRINSEPISEELFADYFFNSWDKIAPEDEVDPHCKLGYFGFLTLMSFDVFLGEKVTIAIYETGVGGEYDTTNIIPKPIATGITNLGIDHERTLRVPNERRPSYFTDRTEAGAEARAGIEEIAWHKGGIFKSRCPAFSVYQDPRAARILIERAKERGALLSFVPPSSDILDVNFIPSIYANNAALAVALVESFIELNPVMKLDSARHRDIQLLGLRSARLSGRCQWLRKEPYDWFIDGAHTKDSLAVAAQWYANVTKGLADYFVPHVLIFNHQSQRDGDALLKSLSICLQDHRLTIDHAVFCPDILNREGAGRAGKFAAFFGIGLTSLPDFVNNNVDPAAISSLSVQYRYAKLWEDLNPTCSVGVAQTIEEAVAVAKTFGNPRMQTLVTGSFHLVGGVLVTVEAE